jgi:hypothetical protein
MQENFSEQARALRILIGDLRPKGQDVLLRASAFFKRKAQGAVGEEVFGTPLRKSTGVVVGQAIGNLNNPGKHWISI